jgi:hypothetical protein
MTLSASADIRRSRLMARTMLKRAISERQVVTGLNLDIGNFILCLDQQFSVQNRVHETSGFRC